MSRDTTTFRNEDLSFHVEVKDVHFKLVGFNSLTS